VGKPVHTRERNDCIVDYDENGKIIGIEFYDGLNDMENHEQKG
jgi:YD repeat-containing protein